MPITAYSYSTESFHSRHSSQTQSHIKTLPQSILCIYRLPRGHLYEVCVVRSSATLWADTCVSGIDAASCYCSWLNCRNVNLCHREPGHKLPLNTHLHIQRDWHTVMNRAHTDMKHLQPVGTGFHSTHTHTHTHLLPGDRIMSEDTETEHNAWGLHYPNCDLGNESNCR